MEYMDKFKLGLKFSGTSHTFSKEKMFKKRGIECSKEDFQPEYKFVENDNYEVFRRKKGLSYNVANQSNEYQNTLTLTKTLQMYQSSENVELFEKFMENQRNKNKYDSYIKNQRQVRMRSEQQAQIKTKIKEVYENNQKDSNAERRKMLHKQPLVKN